MYHHILIPTDGSELSEKAIVHGVALAKTHNAKITALHVTAPFSIPTFEPIAVAPNAADSTWNGREQSPHGILRLLPTRRKQPASPAILSTPSTITPIGHHRYGNIQGL